MPREGVLARRAGVFGVCLYDGRSLQALHEIGSHQLCGHGRQLHSHQDGIYRPAVAACSQAVELARESFDVFAQLDDSIRNHYLIATAFDLCRLFNRCKTSVWPIRSRNLFDKHGIRMHQKAGDSGASSRLPPTCVDGVKQAAWRPPYEPKGLQPPGFRAHGAGEHNRLY